MRYTGSMGVFKSLLWIVPALGLLLCAGVVCLYPDKVKGKVERWYKETDVALNLANAMPPSSRLLQAVSSAQGLSNPELWIAHGGGIGKYVYSNCEEAVRDSLSRGFTYVELDLMQTSDGYLVGGHTWDELRAILGVEPANQKQMRKAEIEALKPQGKYTPLFAADICRLMQENPQMILVTDKTQDFELLQREIPYPDRMIIEAFSVHDYLRALRAGFKHVALTAGSLHDLQQAQKYKLSGVVLWAKTLKENPAAVKLAQQLHEDGCCIMVHGASVSDAPDFVHEYLGRSISRIYTDTWAPTNPPAQP